MTKDSIEVTKDGFLNGAVVITQPKSGFRAGSDAVLLAAALNVESGQSILDVGSGVGTAGFCALYRVAESQLWAIELQENLVKLAQRNAEQNNLQDRAHIIHADIGVRMSFRGATGPYGKRLLEEGFDHVITNPPFYGKGRAQKAKSMTKTISHIESSVALADWLQFCLARTKSKGTVTVIHRAERLADILAALSPGCGSFRVIPLWPSQEVSAKRVIVQGIKGDKGPLELTKGIVLHETDGTPTDAANRLLRDGEGLKDVL